MKASAISASGLGRGSADPSPATSASGGRESAGILRWAILLASAFSFPLVEASPQQGSARTFLSQTFSLSQADIQRLDAGQVVSRTLPTGNSREVATLGIVRIATTPEHYVERLSDIATFKRTDDVLQIGTFSDPGTIGDLAGLTLDEGDVQRLRGCRVDDCGVRLSAEAIRHIAEAVDWRSADATQQATHLVRQFLVDYVGRYRRDGAAALMEYADRTPHLDLRAELAALVASDRVTWPHLQGLREHVLHYPAARADTTDLIYWSKERVYKRPVISVTHLSIMRQPDESPIRFGIASKQIYAMHYFDASLGLTLLVPDRSSPSPETFVVYLNRSRIDLFNGVFGGLIRRIVSGRARSLVASQLDRLQRELGP